MRNTFHYSDVDMLRYTGKTNGEVPMAYDVDAVKAAVRNILMWRVGENVIRPEFGHNIHRSMYEQLNDFNKDKVCEEIKRAIEENEPRASVHSVSVKSGNQDDEENNNTLHVRVVYSVVGNKADGTEFVEEA